MFESLKVSADAYEQARSGGATDALLSELRKQVFADDKTRGSVDCAAAVVILTPNDDGTATASVCAYFLDTPASRYVAKRCWDLGIFHMATAANDDTSPAEGVVMRAGPMIVRVERDPADNGTEG